MWLSVTFNCSQAAPKMYAKDMHQISFYAVHDDVRQWSHNKFPCSF